MYEFSIPGQLRTVQGGTIGLRCMVFPYTFQGQGTGTIVPSRPAWGGGGPGYRTTWAGSLNDLIRPQQERRRDRQPEFLGRPYIDDQVKPYGLFHRQFAWLSSFQNLVHKGRGLPPQFGPVRAIAPAAASVSTTSWC
jgi:hypothetical protein